MIVPNSIAPMNVLEFENDGPSLLSSNYWQSEMPLQGNSTSQSMPAASACSSLRVSMLSFLICAGAKHIVVSMLPRAKWIDREYCLEWIVEDGSDTPWSCHLSPGQVDRAPNQEDVGKE